MKFSTSALFSLVYLLPLLAQVDASPFGSFKGGAANNGKNGNQGGKNQNQGGAASTSAASAAASATASAAAAASGDPQTSLTLDPSVIATGFANNGQDVPEAGQVASLTSTNNFINFCATVSNLPITNGKQITTGSCNPAPMGIIAATTNMPSSKFVFPKNGAVIQENTAFTISMAIQNLETGHFVNANENYFSAPQQVNTAGDVQGHSHVVIDFLDALDQTTPTNPTRFAFFKGLNDAAQNGVLTADVTQGLPAGAYRLASINTAANHQPVLVAIAQHGGLDDMVYFTVSANANDTGSSVDFGGSAATQGVPPPASTTAAAASAASSSVASAAASAAGGKKGVTTSAAAGKTSATASAAAGKGATTAAAGKGAATASAASTQTSAATKGGNNAGNGNQNNQGGNKSGNPFQFRPFKREH